MTPELSYVICTMPRSGSHLLTEALQLTGVAGKPDEYFFCDVNGRFQNEAGAAAAIHGKKTVAEFGQLALDLGTTPNGVFGVVLMGSYLEQVNRNFQTLPYLQGLPFHELLTRLIGNPRYIWLTRRDKLAQAISMLKASQTDVWGIPENGHIKPKQEPVFDYRSIEFFVRYFEEAEGKWEAYFRENHITSHMVVYEDFVENYENTVLDILAYLGIAPPKNWQPTNSTWQKQADATSANWADTYLRIKNQPSEKVALFAYQMRCKLGKITVKRWLRQRLKMVL